MKPPPNPLAGTLGGKTGGGKKQARRGIFAPLIARSHVRRPRRRGYVDDRADNEIRARGIPVFDQAAQRAELGSYGVRDTRRR